jgi:hypothetical protein
MYFWFKALVFTIILSFVSLAVPQGIVAVEKESKSFSKSFAKKLDVAGRLSASTR